MTLKFKENAMVVIMTMIMTMPKFGMVQETLLLRLMVFMVYGIPDDDGGDDI